jgi:hypothetical protein
MFDQAHQCKVKNDKIARWRVELSNYHYDIIYRPGKENNVADALSRICAMETNRPSLLALHDSLCHPGVSRMIHFVRSKNLPYSVDDVKKMTANCRICAEVKPQFVRSSGQLIKATQPFERLGLDFKGPLPSTTNNRYILTVVDEFSRFPFAFPCADMTIKTVITCLTQLFAIFGLPSFIDTDRGTSFMTEELRQYLVSKNVSTSRTSPYNPRGNGQVERYNGTIWRTISLSLKSRDLPTSLWETALPDALHSIRSLLCTATNATPHEKVFTYTRRSSSGRTIPSWLFKPGPVYLKRHVRSSKYDPVVDEVELIEANPEYAHVRFPNGRQSTVSIRDIAPLPTPVVAEPNQEAVVDADENANEPLDDLDATLPAMDESNDDTTDRVQRLRHPPSRLQDYELN